MRVAVAYEVGAPLVVEDLPTPAIGPHDVLVRLAASGICHTDLTVIRGLSNLPLPIVPGYEGCGTVEAVGPEVRRTAVGDRVLASVSPACGSCWWCLNGLSNHCELCDACYSTHLLGHWVRERRAITLQHAVWRLTGHPRTAFRIRHRGLVEEGFIADLVAFDPGSVGCTPVERVHDQPGGADRLVVRSTGVERMWVNGEPTRVDGDEVPGVAPGRLIRA